jgi:hypothetical protein
MVEEFVIPKREDTLKKEEKPSEPAPQKEKSVPPKEPEKKPFPMPPSQKKPFPYLAFGLISFGILIMLITFFLLVYFFFMMDDSLTNDSSLASVNSSVNDFVNESLEEETISEEVNSSSNELSPGMTSETGSEFTLVDESSNSSSENQEVFQFPWCITGEVWNNSRVDGSDEYLFTGTVEYQGSPYCHAKKPGSSVSYYFKFRGNGGPIFEVTNNGATVVPYQG